MKRSDREIIFGMVQSGSRSVRENLARICSFAEEAKSKQCTALCFPEAYLTGYSSDPAFCARAAIPAEDAVLAEVQAVAEDTGVDLMAGFLERYDLRTADGALKTCYAVTHGLFLSCGETGFYRKTHLGEKESFLFTPGDALPVFTLSSGWKAAVQLCVETHFPEITQTCSLKGAEVVFAPFAVPGSSSKRSEIWKKYLPARSYDNRVYLAACNQLDARFGGGIFVTGPDGEILAEDFSGQEGMLLWKADREMIRRYHCASQPDAAEGGAAGSMAERYYPDRRRAELYRF